MLPLQAGSASKLTARAQEEELRASGSPKGMIKAVGGSVNLDGKASEAELHPQQAALAELQVGLFGPCLDHAGRSIEQSQFQPLSLSAYHKRLHRP